MKIRLILFLALLAGFTACQSPELERPRIPIFWGMRFDDPQAEAELNPNLVRLRDLVMRELVLELPLAADSAGLPYIPDLPFGSIKGLLLKHKVGLHITLAPLATKDLFPEGQPLADPALWFAALEKEIAGLLDYLQPCPVDRVVVGSNLGPVEAYGDEWAKMFANLRKGRDVLFSYGASPEHLAKFPNLKASDELAVDYPPGNESDLMARSRNINQGIEHIADSLHLPVYIFRANLIGDEQTAQFQNRLRYWTKKMRFRAIVVNTIYPKLPLRDSTSYYGLLDNPEFNEFLEEYRNRE
jgi:hypothetical protein